jgi:hypothetical protein
LSILDITSEITAAHYGWDDPSWFSPWSIATENRKGKGVVMEEDSLYSELMMKSNSVDKVFTSQRACLLAFDLHVW